MKKIIWFTIFILLFMFAFGGNSVNAKEVLNSKAISTLTGETLGSMEIYDNGEIVVKYKYGLRRVDLFYCEKDKTCEYDVYSIISLVDSSIENPFKNNNPSKLEVYEYQTKLDETKEYKFRVEAYFAKNSTYKGGESIKGSPSITSLQMLDTKDKYINGKNMNDTGNKEVDDFINKVRELVNTIIIPILYSIIGMILVVKGALLGVQIVKSADNPEVRLEKVKSMKWLIIGVGIAFGASTLVGLLTGFFKDIFS